MPAGTAAKGSTPTMPVSVATETTPHTGVLVFAHSYRREDLAEQIWQGFRKRYHPSSLRKLLRHLGFSRQKTRL
jgi:hypothetical protein